mmetsp:Transcript_29087/g.56985  ORF Transcript_29087/g.56985 Transcript_29087/m.56985 type:complete len:337 (+) Transcript_29087:144-1154(+)
MREVTILKSFCCFLAALCCHTFLVSASEAFRPLSVPPQRRITSVPFNAPPASDESTETQGEDDGEDVLPDIVKEPEPVMVDEKRDRVLVVGATGRVGQRVVRSLLDNRYLVRCAVRKPETASALFSSSSSHRNRVEICPCDIVTATDASLDSVVSGCTAVIDVHGVKPPRLTRWRDLFVRDPLNGDDPSHPAVVNYAGPLKLLEAAKRNAVSKYIRLTGLSSSMSPFTPIAFLFNMLLSMTVKWHERFEIALRSSGLDYTILQPGELTNAPLEEGDGIVAGCQAADSIKDIAVGRGLSMPRDVVASVCVEALSNSLLGRTTVGIGKAFRKGSVGVS